MSSTSNATKSQLVEFISENFVTADEGIHPTKSQLDSFKKDELVQFIDLNEDAKSTFAADYNLT